MLKLLKKNIVALLRRRNRWLCYFPPNVPTGIDMAHDLGLLVKSQKPIIFDVGANIGQSIELFQGIRPHASIYAFEPTTECFHVLSQKSYGNRVNLFQIALSDREETRKFYQYEDTVFNSLLPMDKCSENRFAYVNPTESLMASTRTIDGLVDELNLSCIDLLKIDTQGFDHHVLLGAGNVFKRSMVKVVSVELNFVAMYEGQDKAEAIMSFLNKNEFKLVGFYEIIRQQDAIAWCTALYIRQ